METCPHCQREQEPRIDLRQAGAEDPNFGGATGIRRMIVCSKCHQVLRPFEEPAAPQVTAEDIEGIMGLGDIAAALGVPGPRPRPGATQREAFDELCIFCGKWLGGPVGDVMKQHCEEPSCIASRRKASPEPGPVHVHATRTPVQPPSADDIERDARRRLEFVRAEIAKLRGYEAEEERLELMLSALAPASQERAAG